MTFYPYVGAERPEAFLHYQQASDPDGHIDACMGRLTSLAGRVVLDLGAGNGFHARRFAREAARVIAVEPDPRMRRQCDDLLAVAPAEERFELLPGDAEGIPLPDASVDVVHARYAYFFGTDACLPGLAEVCRVLRPGGSLIIIDSSCAGDLGRIYRKYFPHLVSHEPDMLAFWQQHGFSHHLVETEWRVPDRATLATALSLEHSSAEVEAILAEVRGTTLTYAAHVFHWRKPARPDAPVPRAIRQQLGAERIARAAKDQTSSNNGAIMPVSVQGGPHAGAAILKILPHGISEEAAWRALSRQAVPIPRFLAAWKDDLQREVLLVERLEPHRLDGRNPQDFAAMITTLAHFNLATCDEVPAGPPNRVQGWCHNLHALWQRCYSGTWGADAAAAAAPLEDHWQAITAHARRLDDQLARFPSVVTHHDPAFGNWGRRTDSNELLLFDLGYTDRAPVGRDLALLLGGFQQARPDDGRERWLAQWLAHSDLAFGLAELRTAVELWLQAQPLWMDARTISQAQRAFIMEPDAFHSGWAPWFARTWDHLSSTVLRSGD